MIAQAGLPAHVVETLLADKGAWGKNGTKLFAHMRKLVGPVKARAMMTYLPDDDLLMYFAVTPAYYYDSGMSRILSSNTYCGEIRIAHSTPQIVIVRYRK